MMVVLGVNLLGTAFAGVSAVLSWGWTAAFLNILGLSVIYHINALKSNNVTLTKLAYFGTIAGLVELAADHWLVKVINVLEYPQSGPFIWDSPLYMPLSWAGMLITIGLLGYYLSKRVGLVWGSLLSSLIMGLYVPLYEQMAYSANWWSYKNAPSFGDVPYFIFLGEFFIGLPLTYITIKSKKASGEMLTIYGVLVGLWILVSYWLAYNMIEFFI